MQIGLSEIIAIISLMESAIAFARTIRRRPEASWMNTYIVTTVPNATPPIDDGCGRNWWNDKDWQTRHRIAERVRGWNAHRRFHRNPEDAIKAPKPDI